MMNGEDPQEILQMYKVKLVERLVLQRPIVYESNLIQGFQTMMDLHKKMRKGKLVVKDAI